MDVGDGDTPGAQPVDEGLRAVDRINDPHSIGGIEPARPRLLTQEGVTRELIGKPRPDKALDCQVGLTRHVLGAFTVHDERFDPLEIVQGNPAGLTAQCFGKREASDQPRIGLLSDTVSGTS